MTDNYGSLIDKKLDLEMRGFCSCKILRQLKRDEICIHCLDKMGADTDSDQQNYFLRNHFEETRRN
jgi:hypothetical protein